MKGKQQNQRRRKYNNTRRMKKKSPSNKALNKKIHHIENQLIELKFADIFDAGTVVTAAGVSTYLSGVVQADTASSRTGNEIWPTSIQIKMNMFTDTTLLGVSFVRCVLFWDRQPNGASPVLSGVGTTQSLLDTTTITDTTLAPHNYNSIKRYTVLFDRVFALNPQTTLAFNVASGATTAVVSMQQFINKYKRLSRVVKYSNTSAAIASATSNALHVAYFTDAVASAPSIQGGYRMYFKDA